VQGQWRERATERTIFAAAAGEEAKRLGESAAPALGFGGAGRDYIEELEDDLPVRSPSSVKWAWISDRKKKAHTKYLRPSEGSPYQKKKSIGVGFYITL
jgi:hypothetical protein